MNYMALIRAFDQWLEHHYLPSASQLLWYRLAGLCNRCGWPEWVSVDNLRLMAMIQCRREATFIEARNNLIENRLLGYRKGRKGCPGQYQMLELTFTSEVQTVAKTKLFSSTNRSQSEVQTVAITKPNQTKTKTNNTTPLPPPGGDGGGDDGKKPTRRRKPSDNAVGKKPYGVEQNVMLTDEEYEGLNTKLQWSVKADLIDELSLYLASKGDKYKNHSATLQAWDRKRKEQGAPHVDNTKPVEAAKVGEMQSDGSFISDDGITRWYPPDGFYEAHPELQPSVDSG